LNGGAGTFTDCEKQKCVSSMIDLQNTVTHEAGHLLGLGHSTVIGATMQASTSSTPETSKRDLAPDDQKGYCALNLPEWKCTGSKCMCPAAPVYPSKKTTHSCSCTTVGADDTGGWSVCALAIATTGWRLRRRQQLRT